MEYRTEGEYVIVGEIEGSWGGYEWEILAVAYHPGRDVYYLYSDCGCSCNYPYDTVGFSGSWEPDSSPMWKQDILKEIYRHRTDEEGTPLRLEEYNDLAREVLNFNPSTVNN